MESHLVELEVGSKYDEVNRDEIFEIYAFTVTSKDEIGNDEEWKEDGGFQVLFRSNNVVEFPAIGLFLVLIFLVEMKSTKVEIRYDIQVAGASFRG